MGTLLIDCARNLSVRNFPQACLDSLRLADNTSRIVAFSLTWCTGYNCAHAWL